MLTSKHLPFFQDHTTEAMVPYVNKWHAFRLEFHKPFSLKIPDTEKMLLEKTISSKTAVTVGMKRSAKKKEKCATSQVRNLYRRTI